MPEPPSGFEHDEARAPIPRYPEYGSLSYLPRAKQGRIWRLVRGPDAAAVADEREPPPPDPGPLDHLTAGKEAFHAGDQHRARAHFRAVEDGGGPQAEEAAFFDAERRRWRFALPVHALERLQQLAVHAAGVQERRRGVLLGESLDVGVVRPSLTSFAMSPRDAQRRNESVLIPDAFQRYGGKPPAAGERRIGRCR
jgi:hypothetical protein